MLSEHTEALRPAELEDSPAELLESTGLESSGLMRGSVLECSRFQ